MLSVKRYLLLLLAFLFCHMANAYENVITHDSVVALEQMVKCDDIKDDDTRERCAAGVRVALIKLKEANITLSANEVIYYANPVQPNEKLPTGHACSHRAWLTGSEGALSIDRSETIDVSHLFKGESYQHTIAAQLPMNVDATLNLKEEWGHKAWSIHCSGLKCKKKEYCNSFASDTWNALLDASTQGRIDINVDLQPTHINVAANGNTEITIKPISVVNIELNHLDPDVKLVGKNALLTALMGPLTMAGSITRYLEDIGEGHSNVEARDQFYEDLGYVWGSVFSSMDQLWDVIIEPTGAETPPSVYEIFIRERIIERTPGGVERMERRLENTLNMKLAGTFKLSEEGVGLLNIPLREFIEYKMVKLSPVLIDIVLN